MKCLDVHDEFSPAQLCLLEHIDSGIPVLDVVVVVGMSDTHRGFHWCWQGVDDDDDAVFQAVWTQVRDIVGDGR